jgi:hypothetical protein
MSVMLFLAVPLSIAAALGLVAALGLDLNWGAPVAIFLSVLLLRLLANLLRKGWFPWLLREPKGKAAG